MVDVQASNTKLRRRAVSLVALAAGADAATAEQALAAADGGVKVAIATLHLNITAQEAAARLAAADGRLHQVLGEE
jgi:N-acetylmuramic acid 6-phosphate etherase